MNYLYGSYLVAKNKLQDLQFSREVPNRYYPKGSTMKMYQDFYGPMTEILPNLYLGSSFNASNYDELQNNNITVIFNITHEISNYYDNNPNIKYYQFPIKDNGKEDITNILLQTADLINYHVNKGDRILVHCYMGASRSVSVILYYLIKYHNMPLNDALNYVKEKRPVVNPTCKFYYELQMLVK